MPFGMGTLECPGHCLSDGPEPGAVPVKTKLFGQAVETEKRFLF